MKVLIVDDSRGQRTLLTRILSTEGYEVVGAENGRTALAMLGEGLDVVVCDLLMPGLEGDGLLGVLARWRNPIPVVITSVDAHHSTQDKCRALGAAAFLAKPYSDREILSAVAKAVEASSVVVVE